jgi:RNA-directed DNA polymerase
MQNEEKLSQVSSESKTKQGREALHWVERSVWNDRMLQTLVTGVKGGKWFSLIDKVYSKQNLLVSYQQVRTNRGCAGVDHVNVIQFGEHLQEEVERLHEELKTAQYEPQQILRVYIPKPGTTKERPLGIPTVRDRVVQTALRNVLEPIFELEFAEHSYGFRPERSCKDALRRVDHLLKTGYRWVVEIDFESYFDTIPHEPLMQLVAEKISDGRVLELLRQFLLQSILTDAGSWTPDKGSPQGAVISPLLSNIYLNPMDHYMVQRKHEMVRYADDAVILCRTENEAHVALDELQQWAATRQLKLHPVKTCIVDMSQPGGIDFLGYHFEVSRKYPDKIRRWPRKKSMNKLHEAIRIRTRRTNGHSLEAIISQINPILRGWFEYFKHSHTWTFKDIDGWVRMRLRSILRKRNGRKGRGRGNDHQRWTNAYFRDLGLFSTVEARGSLTQSPSG